MGSNKAGQDVDGGGKIKRQRGNTLARWEVAIVKAMLARQAAFGSEQDIPAYFTRPTWSVTGPTLAFWTRRSCSGSKGCNRRTLQSRR